MGAQPSLALSQTSSSVVSHPRALHIPALDLADVERGVQRGSAIMQHIGAQDAVLPPVSVSMTTSPRSPAAP